MAVQKVLRRKDKSAGVGLRAVLAAQTKQAFAVAIPSPPEYVSHKTGLTHTFFGYNTLLAGRD